MVENSTSQSLGYPQSHHSNMINIVAAIRRNKANKVSHWFSFFIPLSILHQQHIRKKKHVGQRALGGFVLQFQPWLRSHKNWWGKMWGEDGHAQPASGESFYVAVQVAVGPNRPRLLVASAGQMLVGARRGKNEVDLIHPGLWQVCFYVFVFSSLPKSLFAGQGASPWWHCQMTASVTVRLSRSLHTYYLDNLLKCYSERKLVRSKSRLITPLKPVQLDTICSHCSPPLQFSHTRLCRFDDFSSGQNANKFWIIMLT